MAQPTRCDGHVGRRRLSHNNLRRTQWRRRLRARRRRPRRSGNSSSEFGGARVEHPFFSVLNPFFQFSSCRSPETHRAPGASPRSEKRQRPGRRARRQSAPGRRATHSQSTTTERGDYRWRRRLKARRRRRRRRDNFRRFAIKGGVRFARPLFLHPRQLPTPNSQHASSVDFGNSIGSWNGEWGVENWELGIGR